MNEDDLAESVEDSFAQLAGINPTKAIAIACGLLVGLVEYQSKLQGYDENKQVTLDGNGECRSITIHAKG